MERWKGSLVTKGFLQHLGIAFTETFVPVGRRFLAVELKKIYSLMKYILLQHFQTAQTQQVSNNFENINYPTRKH